MCLLKNAYMPQALSVHPGESLGLVTGASDWATLILSALPLALTSLLRINGADGP